MTVAARRGLRLQLAATQTAAGTLRTALASVGLGRDQSTATAGTLSDGRGIVRLKGNNQPMLDSPAFQLHSSTS